MFSEIWMNRKFRLKLPGFLSTWVLLTSIELSFVRTSLDIWSIQQTNDSYIVANSRNSRATHSTQVSLCRLNCLPHPREQKKDTETILGEKRSVGIPDFPTSVDSAAEVNLSRQHKLLKDVSKTQKTSRRNKMDIFRTCVNNRYSKLVSYSDCNLQLNPILSVESSTYRKQNISICIFLI